ncbi:signal peptide peptidase SppA [Alsobacter sp. R-9]
MSAESDYLVDRRRMSRKVGFWRGMAFLVALVAILGAGLAVAGRGEGGFGAAQNHIARIEISGVITGDQRTLDLIKDVGKSRAKAVIVQIDSPGGTVTGSELLFNALRDLSSSKPTVAVVRSLAASGGYLAAMGTDRIVAQETSLVGSVGVLFQYPNVTRLLDTVGVKMETVKSAPLKAAPSPFEPTTPEAEAAVRSLVASNFAWFKRIVGDRRQLSGAPLDQVSDGRVFTGMQGLDLRLVDEIGSEKQAIAWLEKARGVDKDLPVREWKRRSNRDFGLWSSAAWISDIAGFDALTRVFHAAARSGEQPALDGLLALWQP